MAHPNIHQRQAHVQRLLADGVDIRGQIRKDLSALYQCSPSAIIADITAFTRPPTIETPFQSASMRRRIFARDGRVCQYCGDVDAYEYVIEHVIPAALGGIARPHNLVVSCQSCNVRKRRRVWLPCNLDTITRDHPEWCQKIISLNESRSD
ncbi:HNH endonuclease [Luteolibacter sp. Populi]|uniref:HNH endonuclease n=1 Tax=Luteolibacter sp. Populi TaxID=3230487 RepID=UPI0034670F4C